MESSVLVHTFVQSRVQAFGTVGLQYFHQVFIIITVCRLVELLLARGADVNAQTEAHKTPLILASFAGQLETVKLLIARGADLHAKDKSMSRL